MTIFLTSNIGGIKKENGIKTPVKFIEDNNFLINLKESIIDNKKFIMIASDPTNIDNNDKYLDMDKKALKLSGLEFDEYCVLDNRNKEDVEKILNNGSLIFLCGGDTYIQNKFFCDINLKQHLKKVLCPIVGISAGSINLADNVINIPETIEDLVKPLSLLGLGLTKYNIEPHFKLNDSNFVKNDILIRKFNNRVIYGIPDGTYIKNNIVYGKCYKIYKGKVEIICDDNEYKILN